MLVKVTRRDIFSSEVNMEESSQVFLPQQGYQEVNIFLSLERNPSLSSPASRLSLLPAELSMGLPPGHKQQKEPRSRAHTSMKQMPAPPTHLAAQRLTLEE